MSSESDYNFVTTGHVTVQCTLPDGSNAGVDRCCESSGWSVGVEKRQYTPRPQLIFLTSLPSTPTKKSSLNSHKKSLQSTPTKSPPSTPTKKSSLNSHKKSLPSTPTKSLQSTPIKNTPSTFTKKYSINSHKKMSPQFPQKLHQTTTKNSSLNFQTKSSLKNFPSTPIKNSNKKRGPFNCKILTRLFHHNLISIVVWRYQSRILTQDVFHKERN